MTVHDLFAVSHPELSAGRALNLQRNQLAAIGRASIVVTLSSATADRIADWSGLPRHRIVATSVGAPALAARPSRPGPDAPIVAVGALTPRKGFQILAEAISLLRGTSDLVIAGPDGYGASEVRSAIRGRARYAGFVSDADLDRLYRTAAVVCVPSLAEGFGFTCLEAMSQGAAVVASDLPSLREIAGDAAVLVRPGDPTELAAALDRVLGDEDLRGRLAERALARASTFTWEAATDRLVAAYRLACA